MVKPLQDVQQTNTIEATDWRHPKSFAPELQCPVLQQTDGSIDVPDLRLCTANRLGFRLQ